MIEGGGEATSQAVALFNCWLRLWCVGAFFSLGNERVRLYCTLSLSVPAQHVLFHSVACGDGVIML